MIQFKGNKKVLVLAGRNAILRKVPVEAGGWQVLGLASVLVCHLEGPALLVPDALVGSLGKGGVLGI